MKDNKVYVQNNQFLFMYQESFYCMVYYDPTAFMEPNSFTELQTLIKWGEEKVNVVQFMECSMRGLTSEKEILLITFLYN